MGNKTPGKVVLTACAASQSGHVCRAQAGLGSQHRSAQRSAAGGPRGNRKSWEQAGGCLRTRFLATCTTESPEAVSFQEAPAISCPAHTKKPPRHIRPVLQPRPEGPAAPLGLSLENKPGSCLVSSHPWLQLPEGMPPAARPGPVRTRVCHHRHAQITCVRHHRHTRTRVCVLPQMRTQARAHVRHHRHGTALAGLLRPWGPRALLGQDTHLSEHPYICICPRNLPAAEDSSGTEKGQTSPAPPPAGTVGSSGLGPQPRGPLKPVPLPHSPPALPAPRTLPVTYEAVTNSHLTFSPRHCLLCLGHPPPTATLRGQVSSVQTPGWGLPWVMPKAAGACPTTTPHHQDQTPCLPTRQIPGRKPVASRAGSWHRAGNALSPWEPPSPEDTPLAPGRPPLSSLPEEFLWGPFHLQITPVCPVSCPELTL